MTGDEIAAALLTCSEALADAGQAEAVSVPSREPDGTISTVMVLIGPASQIVARDVDTGGDELIDTEAVARLKAIQSRLRPVVTIDGDPPVSTDWDSEF